MPTAVIVSGTLRQLVNASSSWSIPGDYYLIVNQDIHTTSNTESQSNSLDIIAENIRHSHVKFVSTVICNDLLLPDNLKHNATVSMIHKWRSAYFVVLPYMVTKNYDRIVLLRPDLYLHKQQPYRQLAEQQLLPDTVYTTSEIITKDYPGYGVRPIMNDVLLMMTVQTYDRFVNGLHTFYLGNYDLTQTQGYEVHSMLARYCAEAGFTVRADLSNYFDFAILRSNMSDMFQQGSIKPQYGFADIKTRELLWWQETYGK